MPVHPYSYEEAKGQERDCVKETEQAELESGSIQREYGDCANGKGENWEPKTEIDWPAQNFRKSGSFVIGTGHDVGVGASPYPLPF